MTRMGLSGYGLCRTPDGRTVPCDPPPGNQPLGNGLAQLALMLSGSGWLDQADATRRDERSNAFRSPPANSSGPAYGNSWAAMPNNFGRSGSDHHLPITKAQEFFFTPSNPYIEVFPRPFAPEYIPYPPRAAPWPPETFPMPEEVMPPPALPFEGDDDTKPTKEECDRQWAEAGSRCLELERAAQARGNYRFNMGRCVKGLVSAACGGNPVKFGPPRRKFKRYNLNSDSIQA
jgi:hypothetical protein